MSAVAWQKPDSSRQYPLINRLQHPWAKHLVNLHRRINYITGYPPNIILFHIQLLSAPLRLCGKIISHIPELCASAYPLPATANAKAYHQQHPPAAFRPLHTRSHPVTSKVPASPHAHKTPADRDSTTVSFHISGITMWHLTKFGLE